MKKRKQHYVWKYYLKPWTNNNQIYCLRNNNIYPVSLNKIANSRDFYRIQDMSQNDINFLKSFIKNNHYIIQNLNLRWMNIFTPIINLNKILLNSINNKEIKKQIDLFLNNTEEDLQSNIEKIGKKYLKQLYNLEINFFQSNEEYSKFIFYLSMQYFRTKAMKENVAKGIPSNKHFENNNIWNLLKIILATNLTSSLISHQNNWCLNLLKNNTTTYYITGDQPIVNTYAKKGKESKELEFYYPISPNLAISINNDKKSKIITLSENDVKKYNDYIKYHSFEQLYANSKETLEIYLQK